VTALSAVTPAPLKPTRAHAVALVALVAAGGCLARLEPSALTVLQAAVAGLLVWLAALDLEFRLLPDRLMLPATAAVLAVLAIVDQQLAVVHALAAVGAAVLLLVAALARPGGLGMGDVKLGLLLGATLGASVLTALTIGLGLAALAGVGLVARHGRSALRRQLPLGPYLALGALLDLLL
jgi:leader peptidase (prepilin peptidase) / N-methyltransferase